MYAMTASAAQSDTRTAGSLTISRMTSGLKGHARGVHRFWHYKPKQSAIQAFLEGIQRYSRVGADFMLPDVQRVEGKIKHHQACGRANKIRQPKNQVFTWSLVKNNSPSFLRSILHTAGFRTYFHH